MLRTRVGYCGGSTPAPTYRRMGDHAESIQVDFDPRVVTYEQLLEVFWTSHNPCRTPWSRQYMSAVFWHDDAQRAAIESTRRRFVETPDAVRTEIAPFDRFWIAEDYHQKYRLRADGPLHDELRALFDDERAFVDSTAAARVNAWLDGHGAPEQLERELGRLGLTAAGEARLLRLAR